MTTSPVVRFSKAPGEAARTYSWASNDVRPVT